MDFKNNKQLKEHTFFYKVLKRVIAK